jgi:signal transduction histidine kinase
LVNVLSNAYQFTPRGGHIDVQGSTEGDFMTIVVRDKGTGISGDILPYIFEPFYSTRKDNGGSGLGLAITKKIIERHNGSIRVESTPGEETVFSIRLPVKVDEND